MKTLLRWLVWIVLVVLAVLWLSRLDGRIHFEPLQGDGWSLSAGLGILVLVLAVAVALVLLRVIGALMRLPGDVREWWMGRRERRSFADFDQAVRRFLLGDYATAARLVQRAQSTASLQLAAHWLHARAQRLAEEVRKPLLAGDTDWADPVPAPQDDAAWRKLAHQRAAADDGAWRAALTVGDTSSATQQSANTGESAGGNTEVAAPAGTTPVWLEEVKLRTGSASALDAAQALDGLLHLRRHARLDDETFGTQLPRHLQHWLAQQTHAAPLLKLWDKTLDTQPDLDVLRGDMAPALLTRLRALGAVQDAQRVALDTLDWAMLSTEAIAMQRGMQSARAVQASLPDWEQVSERHLQRLEQLANTNAPGRHELARACGQWLFGWVCMRQQLRGKARHALTQSLQALQTLEEKGPGQGSDLSASVSASEADASAVRLVRQQVLALLISLAEAQREDPAPWYRALHASVVYHAPRGVEQSGSSSGS